jgi:hypothetical protein
VALSLLTFLILPNILFWIPFRETNIPRALVNVDFLLLGMIAPWLSARMIVICYALLGLIDFTIIVCSIYFLGLSELFSGMMMASEAHIGVDRQQIFFIAVYLACLCCGAWLAGFTTPGNALGSAWLLAVAISVSSADFSNGTLTHLAASGYTGKKGCRSPPDQYRNIRDVANVHGRVRFAVIANDRLARRSFRHQARIRPALARTGEPLAPFSRTKSVARDRRIMGPLHDAAEL